MIRARLREATHHHITVANGLDFLQAILLGNIVKRREDRIQDLHDTLGCQTSRHGREVDNVGEQDGDFAELIGNRSLPLLEALGNRLRQDIQQESFRLGVGFGQFARAEFDPLFQFTVELGDVGEIFFQMLWLGLAYVVVSALRSA
jgi:hypothetical protein